MKEIVFLCGARDFHALDWYKSAKANTQVYKVSILTDLIAGEGYKKIITDQDNVHRLLVLDKLLFRKQSRLGNIWRNILKLIVFPLQLLLLKKFSASHPHAIYHAHSMYYLFLADFANIKFIGTPQGSDILIKPFRSKLYKFFTIKALKSASFVTVDSVAMRDKIFALAQVDAKIIQNGIDLTAINESILAIGYNAPERNLIVSIRGFTPLYQIKKMIDGRDRSRNNLRPINFIYPFYEENYRVAVKQSFREFDVDVGRLTRDQLYKVLSETQLVLSLPVSDSSPRSVYEAIFCGCAVAITYHRYYDFLTECMKARIILIDLEDQNWFEGAVQKSKDIVRNTFVPSEEALFQFDQVKSYLKIEDLINKIV